MSSKLSSYCRHINAVKLGRCIKELERIYGIKHGGDRASGHNDNLKSQDDLAEELEMSKSQMNRYKSLTDLIPELQDAVQNEIKMITRLLGVIYTIATIATKKSVNLC